MLLATILVHFTNHRTTRLSHRTSESSWVKTLALSSVHIYFIKLKFLSQFKSSKIRIHEVIEMGVVLKNQFELSKVCIHRIPVLNLPELSLHKSIWISLSILKIKLR